MRYAFRLLRAQLTARQMCRAAILVCCGYLAPSVAWAADPVSAHKNMDAPVVAWCVHHPGHVKTAAAAHGIDVGGEENAAVFIRGGKEMSLPVWASSTDVKDRRDFAKACTTAFAAFSRATWDVALDGMRRNGAIGPQAVKRIADVAKNAQDDEILGVTPDAALGFGGVLAGILLASGRGAVTAHNRENRADAEPLRKYATEFTAAMEAYTNDLQPSAALRERAESTAIPLRAEMEAWQAQQKGSQAEDAVKRLNALLSGDGPRIGNRGDLMNDHPAFKQKLMQSTYSVQTAAENLADRVAHRRRLKDREPELIGSPTGGTS